MNSRCKLTLIGILKSYLAAFTIIGLSSCGSSTSVANSGGFQQDHGPFDRNGNYIESWADNPPKRRNTWRPSIPTRPAPPTAIASNLVPKAPPTVASVNVPRPTQPRTTYTPPRTTYTPPKKVTPPVVAKKPAPKTITPKAKPPIYHTVKKGDTLYDLSRKYGATVAGIQKANNIKGSNIVIGKRLIIPRK